MCDFLTFSKIYVYSQSQLANMPFWGIKILKLWNGKKLVQGLIKGKGFLCLHL